MVVNFGISIIQHNAIRGIGCYTYPPYIGQILNRFMYIFSSLEKVESSINRINRVLDQNDRDNLGDNDFSVEINKDFVTFDLHWDKSDDPLEPYYPLKIPSEEFLHFLFELRDFIVKYESCQIPGIIPESKLDSWVAVPKEFVKEEWWTLLKQNDLKSGA